MASKKAASEAAAGNALRVEVVEEGAVVRQLEVEVPAARVDKAFTRAYAELGRTARVRGFRPGKTPRSQLRKLYGAALAEDVERTLVSESLPIAIEQVSLEPVSNPSVESEAPGEGAPFVFRARVEVQPEFELGELTGLSASRPPEEVTGVAVEEELERLRENHSSLIEEPEDVTATQGHTLSLDFVGRIDGEVFEGGTGRDVTCELGSGGFVPGFEEQLEGAVAGEDRELRVTFPADYGGGELAGKEAVFAAHVASIRRREVPSLDDEFAKDLGDFETLDELRAKVSEGLQTQRDRDVKESLRRTVVDSLLARSRIEVPPGMLAQRLERRIHHARHDLEGRGLPPEWIDSQSARWEEEWRPETEHSIREQWLLEAVGRAQELEAGDDEVDARLTEMAEEQGEDPKKVRKAYQDAGLLEAIRGQLIEDKAVEFLLGEATVEEDSGS